MDLVVTKWIGLEGTALLAEKYQTQLCERFPAVMVDAAKKLKTGLRMVQEREMLCNLKEACIYPLEMGGIFTALWELAEEQSAGLEVDLRKIPIRQETIEICEYFDLNPYNMLSGGSILAAVSEGEALADSMKREGIPGTVIGRLTNGKDRILWNQGNKRFLDRPQKEELWKIFGEDGLEDERSNFNIFREKQSD